MEVVMRLANDSDAEAAFKLIAELGYAELSFAPFSQTFSVRARESGDDDFPCRGER